VCTEWPDYDGESDSDAGSETEVIVADASGAVNQSDAGFLSIQPSHPSNVSSSSSPHRELDASAASSPFNIPADSHTAQKIMHLLDEIGTSNLVDRPPHDATRFLHCVNCSGRLILLWTFTTGWRLF